MHKKIRWWWDRYTRCYIILVLDEDGYEIESRYNGNKVSHQYELDMLAKDYNITDVAKYKVGE